MIDSHCHIHMADYGLDAATELAAARELGVESVICIGEGEADSKLALAFAEQNSVYAAIGVHPHSAKDSGEEIKKIGELVDGSPKELVAVGECGLDYYYLHSPKAQQQEAFEKQLELATRSNLPLVFHVRGSKEKPNDAFNDFLSILDGFSGVRGVVHSFSATKSELEPLLNQGLYIGLNGIVTFTTGAEQLAAFKHLPLENMLIETDAPFLTPNPNRGKINSPRYVVEIARFLADIRGEELEKLVAMTAANTKKLFNL